MSNCASSRSAASSLSSGSGEEASAATFTVPNPSLGAGPSAGTEGDGCIPPTASSETASVVVERDGRDSPGGYTPGSGSGWRGRKPHKAAVYMHLEEASSNGDDNGAGVLTKGGHDELPRGKSGRCTGDRNGGSAGLTIEGADQAAYKDSGGAAKVSQKEERRLSPPWDDSTLGLLGLTQDELIDRVLQVTEQCSGYRGHLDSRPDQRRVDKLRSCRMKN